MTAHLRLKAESTGGFSLVELTLALGIMAFCLLGVLGLFSVGVSTSQTSINQTSATNILSQVVADLRSTPNPPPNGKSIVYGIAFPSSGTPTVSNPDSLGLTDDGRPNNSSLGSRYLLSVWATGSQPNQPETTFRLMLSWPANADYKKSHCLCRNVCRAQPKLADERPCDPQTT